MKVSIVILCYNGLEDLTRPCVESIIKYTPRDTYELILVDNGSQDGTANYLNEIAKFHHNVHTVLNKENLGYSAGNNQGMKMAASNYVVLLNNDTLVTYQWLERLLYPFSQDFTIGLVGAVTNSAGNEQRIDLSGINESNFEKIAGEYTQRQRKIWFETEKLGFFCVAVQKSVIGKIGYLDEQFGIGMFEDDDYCYRAKQAGYKIVVAEDCFVFHKGSASFNKLPVGRYKEIFELNKSYYIRKHQVAWLMSDFSLSYCHKIANDLNIYQNQSENIPPAIERILVRYDGFKHLLVHLHHIDSSRLPPDQQFLTTSLASRTCWQARLLRIKRQFFMASFAEHKRLFFRVFRRIGHFFRKCTERCR